MYRKYGSLQGFFVTEGVWMNQAVLRALLGLTVGVFVYLLSNELREKISKKVTVIYQL